MAVDTPHMVGQFGYVLAIEQTKILQKKHYFIVIIELEREKTLELQNLYMWHMVYL